MTRRLTAARAQVPPARREAYLAAVAELAAAHRAVGGHFWLFERDDRAGAFLEFAEHAASRPPDVVPLALATRLADLADYDATRDLAWHEVPLADHPGG